MPYRSDNRSNRTAAVIAATVECNLGNTDYLGYPLAQSFHVFLKRAMGGTSVLPVRDTPGDMSHLVLNGFAALTLFHDACSGSV